MKTKTFNHFRNLFAFFGFFIIACSAAVDDSPPAVEPPVVQNNIGKFNNLFKNGMIIVDNNKADEDLEMMTFKRVRALLRNKVTNRRAHQWIEMEMKRRGITKKPKGF